jgi:hypothetical protein
MHVEAGAVLALPAPDREQTQPQRVEPQRGDIQLAQPAPPLPDPDD